MFPAQSTRFQRGLIVPLVGLVLSMVLWLNPAKAQTSIQEIKWAASCIPDCDDSIHITDFQKVWQQIKRLPCFNNDAFLSTHRKLSQRNMELSSTLDDVGSILDETQSVHVFLTTFDRTKSKPVEFIILINTKAPLEDHIEKIRQFAEQAMAGHVVYKNPFSAKPDVTISVKKSSKENWWVAGSSTQSISACLEIVESNQDQNPGNLANNRRFHFLLGSDLARTSSVVVYCQPKSLPSFFRPGESEDKDLFIHELTAACLFGSFTDNGDRFQVAGRVFNTYPVKGVAEMWEARRPVSQLPASALNLIEVTGMAWDSELLLEAKKKNFDAVNGAGAFDESMKPKSGSSLLDPFVRLYSCNEVITLRYLNSFGARNFIVLERVHNEDKMNELIEFKVKNEDKEGFGELSSDGNFQLYGFSEAAFAKQKQKLISSLKREPDLVSAYENRCPVPESMSKEEWFAELADNVVKNEAFLVSREWVLYGHAPDLVSQFKFMNQEDQKGNRMTDIEERINAAARFSQLDSAPFDFVFDQDVDELRDAVLKHFGFHVPDDDLLQLATETENRSGDDKTPRESEADKKMFANLVVGSFLQALEKNFTNRLILFSKTTGDELQFFLVYQGRRTTAKGNRIQTRHFVGF